MTCTYFFLKPRISFTDDMLKTHADYKTAVEFTRHFLASGLQQSRLLQQDGDEDDGESTDEDEFTGYNGLHELELTKNECNRLSQTLCAAIGKAGGLVKLCSMCKPSKMDAGSAESVPDGWQMDLACVYAVASTMFDMLVEDIAVLPTFEMTGCVPTSTALVPGGR